jgi:hypothetical protein
MFKNSRYFSDDCFILFKQISKCEVYLCILTAEVKKINVEFICQKKKTTFERMEDVGVGTHMT